jgi:hypothetical protein
MNYHRKIIAKRSDMLLQYIKYKEIYDKHINTKNG